MKQVFNPYLPLYEYVPDGEPHVFDGRLYIYGSHDLAGGTKYCQGDYVTWSAPVDDLCDWRYEGVIYRREQDPSNPDGKLELWAPDVIKGPDGRYYLYYCLAFHPEIGVAVSDSPAGPFTFYGHIRYPDSMGGDTLRDPMPFDPAALCDDDGRVYLYYGFSPPVENFFADAAGKTDEAVSDSDQETFKKASTYNFARGSLVAELESDMLTLKQKPEICVPGALISTNTGFEEHAFFEGSSIRKVGRKYYFVYSSQQRHELCYAVSDSAVKGFRYGGILVSNADLGLNGNRQPRATSGNNHGGIVNVADDWYVFYHRQTHGTENSRQGCAERIEILPSGEIAQVEMTSCGLNGGPLMTQGNYPAAIACNLWNGDTPVIVDYATDDVKRLPCIREDSMGASEQEHVQYICRITDGTVIGYKYFLFQTVSSLSLTICGDASGRLSVSTGLEPEDIVGEAALQIVGDWQNLEIPIHVCDGEHPLYLMFSGSGEFSLKTVSFA